MIVSIPWTLPNMWSWWVWSSEETHHSSLASIYMSGCVCPTDWLTVTEATTLFKGGHFERHKRGHFLSSHLFLIAMKTIQTSFWLWLDIISPKFCLLLLQSWRMETLLCTCAENTVRAHNVLQIKSKRQNLTSLYLHGFGNCTVRKQSCH